MAALFGRSCACRVGGCPGRQLQGIATAATSHRDSTVSCYRRPVGQRDLGPAKPPVFIDSLVNAGYSFPEAQCHRRAGLPRPSAAVGQSGVLALDDEPDPQGHRRQAADADQPNDAACKRIGPGDSTISTRRDLPRSWWSGPSAMDGVQMGRLAGDLARLASGLLEQNVSLPAARPCRPVGVRAAAWSTAPCKTVQPVIGLGRIDGRAVGSGVCRDRAESTFEGIGAAVAHSATRSRVAWKSASVSPGKPTMKSPDSTRSGRAARMRSIRRI